MSEFCVIKRIAPFGWDGPIDSQTVRGSNGRPITFLHAINAARWAEQEQYFWPDGETRVRHEVVTVAEARAELGLHYDQPLD